MPDHGIGLTDLCKTESGADDGLSRQADDAVALAQKIARHRPAILAFNGKRAAQVFLGVRTVEYGEQPQRLGGTAIHVLPSTSGRASGAWNEAYWHAVAQAVRRARGAVCG